MPEIEQKLDPMTLCRSGPEIDIVIARPEEVQVPAGAGSVSSQIDVRALIDTGSDYCLIRSSLAERLALQKVDEKEFGNSTGVELCDLFMVDVILPGVGSRTTYEVAGASFREQSLEFVLGRNFLMDTTFLYDGVRGTFKITLS